MALLHFDGFQSYANQSDFDITVHENVKSQVIYSGVFHGTGYSRFGSPNRGIRINSNYHVYYNLKDTLSPSTIIVGVVFKKVEAGDPTVNIPFSFIEIRDVFAGTAHLRVLLDSTYNFRAYRYTTLLGTSSGKLVVDNVWHILEVKLYIHDSAGTVELKLDEVQILNLTSQDTLTGSNAYARFVLIRNIANNLDTLFDCLYISDNTGLSPQNDFLGDCRVDVLRPDGVGVHTDFTPLAGNNWENVDDIVPDNNTTYNSSGTVNHKDSYALPSLAAGGTIFGVKPKICVTKDDAGAKGAKILTRSGGTLYESSEVNPSTDYGSFGKIYQDNPHDSAAWEESDIDGLEVGVKVSS